MNFNFDPNSNEIPVVNGILHADGTADFYEICEDAKHRRHIESRSVPIDEITETYADITGRLSFDDIDALFSFGGGSWGGDGYISAWTNEGKFLWIIIFNESNPFISLKKEGNKLLAENNLYEVWEIDITDINKPKISIIQQSRYLHE